jgi:hypothetical protein
MTFVEHLLDNTAEDIMTSGQVILSSDMLTEFQQKRWTLNTF